jgi:hypothetical protein
MNFYQKLYVFILQKESFVFKTHAHIQLIDPHLQLK